MLAWKLPAGTGTFECYVFCIDYGLVWSFPASLAMPPDSTVTVFQQHPLGSCRQPFSGFTEAASGANCMICSSVRFNNMIILVSY